MTNKEQIMIDGVDVSRCKYLPYCNGKQGNCAFNPDYYYKQLARKTQELEVICKAFDIEYAYDDDGIIYGRSNKLRSLEQENEELKKQLETSEKWRIESDHQNARYRKALEEIEEYCENQISITGDLPFRTTASDILDIISKAKGEGCN